MTQIQGLYAVRESINSTKIGQDKISKITQRLYSARMRTPKAERLSKSPIG